MTAACRGQGRSTPCPLSHTIVHSSATVRDSKCATPISHWCAHYYRINWASAATCQQCLWKLPLSTQFTMELVCLGFALTPFSPPFGFDTMLSLLLLLTPTVDLGGLCFLQYTNCFGKELPWEVYNNLLRSKTCRCRHHKDMIFKHCQKCPLGCSDKMRELNSAIVQKPCIILQCIVL